ncbi:Uncharacterised protein [Mycobacteroides abscessus subsp. bolletii]|nr:hypothetical protein [Mycobacteroides abscessus]SKR94491.1 Uncharacterised protein [Mycobacteroides abscessus subsp. bolletii]SKS03081.1 Uncharacterised protein [Mycobacteroides abscessus subsp. bolletii]DAZ90114.1 TPA_asm: hypothetical protein PROPHIFVLQ01-1_27 [Mycobacterium phage prophiFVLQ01-1]
MKHWIYKFLGIAVPEHDETPAYTQTVKRLGFDPETLVWQVTA